MKSTLSNRLHIAFALCLSISFAACDNAPTSPPPRLKGPTDLVQAGVAISSGGGGKHLFVFGGRKNIIYVLDAETLGFVRAPNRYFPLEIAVCQYPSAGAATSDGRYVMIGCAGSDAAYVLDAVAFKLVRDDAGVPLQVALGSGVSQILRAETKTPEGADRFYSLNTYSQSISVLDVVTVEGQPRPTITKLPDITGVGSVVRGVLTSTLLYAADSAEPFVRRIDLSTFEKTDFDVGAPSVDVALARNGSKLYVATPTIQGITVVDTASGLRVNTSPRYAPQAPDSVPYEQIYVGEMPSRVAVLDDDNTALTVQCKSGNGQIVTVSSFALVATENGSVVFIDATRDRVIDDLDCVGPAVTAGDEATGLFSTVFPFVDCRSATTQSRNACVGETGVIVYPGFTPQSRWQLQYEPIIPGADRKGGGGTFLDDNTMTDVGLDLSTLSLQAGDRLVLVGDLLPDQACADLYGVSGSAARELTVTEVTTVDSRGAVRFAPAVNRACFEAAAGAIDYQLRYGAAFLLQGATSGQTLSPIARLNIGGSFGTNNDQAIRFVLRNDITPARDEVYDFTVNSNFQVVSSGRIASATGELTAVGRVPTAIVVVPPNESGTRVGRAFVAYGANDAIISFAAFDTRLLGDQLTYLIR